MALIKCPECGHEVSDTCEKCVHCGYQLKKPQTDNFAVHAKTVHVESHASKIYERDQHIKWIGGIIGGVLLIIMGVILFICCAFPPINQYGEFITMFVIFGIVCIGIGIGCIAYYKYRMDNY